MDYTNLLFQAKKWLDIGIGVLPIIKGTKRPAISWKRYQKRLPTLPEIVRWFGQDTFDLAILCGWQGLTILDFDTISAYLRFHYSHPNIDTLTIKTSRGMHLYFYCEHAQTVMSNEVDIKANGYCLTYPSMHPSGTRYEIVKDARIMRVDELPIEPSMCVVPQKARAYNTPYTRYFHPNIVSSIKFNYPITYLFPYWYASGSHYAMAHCPGIAHNHGDSSPSLSLDLQTNRCNCFKAGCNYHSHRGLSVIDAYMVKNNISQFNDAIRLMAMELEL